MWLIATSCFAQYELDAKEYIMTGYRTVSYAFPLSEIAEKLDADPSALVKDLNFWTDNYISLDSDGERTDYTTNLKGGFWMGKDGNNVYWGNGCIWFIEPSWSLEDDEFCLNIGQMPGSTHVGDKYHAIYALNYNNKKVTFDVSLTIIKRWFDVETSLSKLEILGTIKCSSKQERRSDYTADVVTVDLKEAMNALGYDADFLKDNILDVLYVCQQGDYQEKLDSLTKEWSGTNGWWFGRMLDDNDEYLEELSNMPVNTDWRIYTSDFSFRKATGELSFNVGQFPSRLTPGNHYIVNHYLIKDNKAYVIELTFDLIEPAPLSRISEMTKVGEADLTMEEFPDNAWYRFPVEFPIDSIANLLGIPANTVKLRILENEDELSITSTGSTGGYWYNTDGYACAFGDPKMYWWVEPIVANDLSIIEFGQAPGVFKVGDSAQAKMFFVSSTSYFQYNLTLNIVEKYVPKVEDYELVSDETYEFQIVPSADVWQDTYMAEGIKLDAARIKELLGNGALKFYGEVRDSLGNVSMTDSYNCDPAPGFWLRGNYVDYYGDDMSFAMGYSSGASSHFWFFQQIGSRVAGDAFCSHFYLANESTKKLIKYTIYVKYVDEIKVFETVGTDDIVLPSYDPETEDYIETDYDMTDCYAALGCSEEEFMEMGEWNSMSLTGQFSKYGYEGELYGFWFDKNGEPTQTESEYAFSIEFLNADQSDLGMDCFRTFAFNQGVYKGTIAAVYGTKRYVFNVTLTNDPTGINRVLSTVSEVQEGVYNLAGQKVSNDYKGFVIRNGKKLLVK